MTFTTATMLIDINMLTGRVQNKLRRLIDYNHEKKITDSSNSVLSFLVQQNILYEFIQLVKNYGMNPKINETQAMKHCPPFYQLYMYFIENNRDFEKQATDHINLMTEKKEKNERKRKAEDDEESNIKLNYGKFSIWNKSQVKTIKNVWHLIFMVFTYQYDQNMDWNKTISYGLLKGGMLVRKNKVETSFLRNTFAFQSPNNMSSNKQFEAFKMSQFRMASIKNMMANLTEFAELLLGTSPLYERNEKSKNKTQIKGLKPSHHVRLILDSDEALIIDLKKKENEDDATGASGQQSNDSIDSQDTPTPKKVSSTGKKLNPYQQQNIQARLKGGTSNKKTRATAPPKKSALDTDVNNINAATTNHNSPNNKKRQANNNLSSSDKKKRRQVTPQSAYKERIKMLTSLILQTEKHEDDIAEDVPIDEWKNKTNADLLEMGFPNEFLNKTKGVARKMNYEYKVMKITDKDCKEVLKKYNLEARKWQYMTDRSTIHHAFKVTNLLSISGYSLVNTKIENNTTKDLYLIHQKPGKTKPKKKGKKTTKRILEGDFDDVDSFISRDGDENGDETDLSYEEDHEEQQEDQSDEESDAQSYDEDIHDDLKDLINNDNAHESDKEEEND